MPSPLLLRLLQLTNHSNPFLRTLLPSVGLAYAIQTAFAIPSIALQSERFYDLSGSLTYISCTALSLYLPTLRARYATALAGGVKPAWPNVLETLSGAGTTGATNAAAWNWRMLALSAAVGIWATRLGSFLFARILSTGDDSRFEKIRNSPPKFFFAWFMQATWVSLCLLPVLAVNSLPPTSPAFAAATNKVKPTDILGLTLFISGFLFEVTADRQKSAWSKAKEQKKHSEQFLTSGLWSKSRHPNYFGEATLWTGIATTAAGVLASQAGQAGMGLNGGLAGRIVALAMAGVSPLFVLTLLLKVSGVPMSEKKYDKRFKGNAKYEEWKRNTPMFVPKF